MIIVGRATTCVIAYLTRHSYSFRAHTRDASRSQVQRPPCIDCCIRLHQALTSLTRITATIIHRVESNHTKRINHSITDSSRNHSDSSDQRTNPVSSRDTPQISRVPPPQTPDQNASDTTGIKIIARTETQMYPRADVYFTCERQPLSYPRLAGENSADLTLVVSARVKVTGTTGLRRGEPALARGTALHSNRE